MSIKNLRFLLWALVAIASAFILYMFFLFDAGKPSLVQQELGAEFALNSGKGEVITDEAVKKSAHAIFFGFTHCPEVCPTTLFESTGWLKQLGDEVNHIKFYFITIDPERDTQEQLANYMQAFDPRITGLTGSREEIAKVIKGYRIYVKKVPNEDENDDNYNMDHTASIFLFNKGGSFQGTIAYGENPEVALKKLRKLIAKNK